MDNLRLVGFDNGSIPMAERIFKSQSPSIFCSQIYVEYFWEFVPVMHSLGRSVHVPHRLL